MRSTCKSKSGIHRLITALEERGFLRRMEKRARALEIVRLPENIADAQRPATTRSQAQRLSHGTIRARRAPMPASRPTPAAAAHPAKNTDSDGAISVPVLGRIAAGTPIEALQHKVSEVPVPSGMIGRGDHYALEVAGDSMINAGILDGDTVIINESNTANTGDIVVALVDGQEATLKRLRRRGDSIALEAANPAYETRLYGADRVQHPGQAGGADQTVLSHSANMAEMGERDVNGRICSSSCRV